MADWTENIARNLHRALAAGEETIDAGRQRVSERFGKNRPAHIAAYTGNSDRHATRLMGRVLAKSPGNPVDHAGGVWKNLADTWHRWESDEVPGVPVTLFFQGTDITVVSDGEGYYQATFPPVTRPEGLWTRAEARVIVDGEPIVAWHRILTPSSSAGLGIISDLDDTVIHTGITNLLLAAKLTFLGNAKTRKPLDGVAGLYSAFQKGMSAEPVHPLFYVSSSPWNLHDLLVDFLEINGIPPGPILLRDVGLDRTKFIKEQGHGHKLDKVLALLDGYPDLNFVLVGDSGQEDPAIYAEVCERRPGRIKAVYIRDVDPGTDSERDAAVHRAVKIAAIHGVPMILAPDSEAMSEHASLIGLIPPAAVPAVVSEVRKDEARPQPGEQAVKDAIASVVPEA